ADLVASILKLVYVDAPELFESEAALRGISREDLAGAAIAQAIRGTTLLSDSSSGSDHPEDPGPEPHLTNKRTPNECRQDWLEDSIRWRSKAAAFVLGDHLERAGISVTDQQRERFNSVIRREMRALLSDIGGDCPVVLERDDLSRPD